MSNDGAVNALLDQAQLLRFYQEMSDSIFLHEDCFQGLRGHINAQAERVKELEDLIDTPHTAEYFESVRIEAAHQVKRWGVEHDEGKEPTDWFWLLGYLSGKAVSNPEKRLHHIISSSAVLLNWYRHETGDERTFKPGVGIPEARK